MDIAFLLGRVYSLSDARKAQLQERYEAGSLTEEDRTELKEHLIKAALAVQTEINEAQRILS